MITASTPGSLLLRQLARSLTIAMLAIAPGTCAALAQTDLAEANLPNAPTPQQRSSSSAPADPQTPQTPTQQTPPASQTPPAATPASPSSAEVLKREEHQRILGVVPNFNTVETADNVPPLTPGQKFHLAYKSSVDPFVFVADAFVAGYGQALDSNPGFGQGAQGYFKRFGASYADTVDGTLWGNAILPVLFKEDPRYFRMGTGTFTHRFLYSASTTVWCRRDNGTWGPSYANVLGNFISGGISNAYYPAADRGVEQTLTGALTVTAEGTIGAEFVEFWPDISHHLFKKHAKRPDSALKTTNNSCMADATVC
jgi:hypothetical protein